MPDRRLALAITLVLFVTTFSAGRADDGNVEYDTPGRCIAMTESGLPIERGFNPNLYLLCLGDVF